MALSEWAVALFGCANAPPGCAIERFQPPGLRRAFRRIMRPRARVQRDAFP